MQHWADLTASWENVLIFNVFFFFTKNNPREVFNRALRDQLLLHLYSKYKKIYFFYFPCFSFTSADKYYTFDIQCCSAVSSKQWKIGMC